MSVGDLFNKFLGALLTLTSRMFKIFSRFLMNESVFNDVLLHFIKFQQQIKLLIFVFL